MLSFLKVRKCYNFLCYLFFWTQCCVIIYVTISCYHFSFPSYFLFSENMTHSILSRWMYDPKNSWLLQPTPKSPSASPLPRPNCLEVVGCVRGESHCCVKQTVEEWTESWTGQNFESCPKAVVRVNIRKSYSIDLSIAQWWANYSVNTP